ncbi:MAG: MacB family efflux pump subunit [Bdellovibrio sp. CG10_big_fil_rev_8_21_14_0_10_47_8]|nr:MAG: MacB family efflux pump subunit [Bdellovibrio sp. CG10_big_fil_rev_8_21_14_0_10_47_8]
MIEINNITKTYRMGQQELTVLKGISLTIANGDFVAIMGPSGSGKSTLMHILGLLDVPTSGSYKLNGHEVSKLDEDALAVLRREQIGFIFQQFNLLARISAYDNVALPLLYSQKNTDSPVPKELLAEVGLSDRQDHHPNELSGGQQQRVAIARALVNRPQIIFADEPTGNLDSTSEKEILRILHSLNDMGITVIMVTHEEEIGQQAKRLIRMRDGLIQSDTRREALPVNLSTNQQKAEPTPSHSKSWNLQELTVYFHQGFRTLMANKVRTGLSILGIMIGVAAVVAMLALGKGAQEQIEQQLSSLGSNLLILRSGAVRVAGVAQESGATTRLTEEDAKALQDQIPSLKYSAPLVNGRGQVTYLNKNWSTQITGASPPYAQMHASEPVAGRFFSEQENQMRARVAVIGATLLHELFEDQNPIGEMIKINKINFQIIGVLPEKGASGFRNQDDVIIVPVLTAMHRLMGKVYLDSIELEVNDSKNIEPTQNSILELMLRRKRVPPSAQEDAFQIFNMADIQAALSQTSKTLSLLLAAIAAISLIVGGIGIMNIMLVSVTERTKEIGLRKAIGARRKDILLQFLSESVVVSAVGGVAGIILGWLATLILSSAAGWTTSVSLSSIVLSFFTSAFIGILFGVYPARQASGLHPIDALRFE